MLIDKRNAPEINDIVTIKLASGEEVIGRMIDRTGETVSIGKPVQIVMQPIGPDKMGLAFHPVLGSVSDLATVQFSLATLAVRPVKTNEDVSRNYISATSGLVQATNIPPIRA